MKNYYEILEVSRKSNPAEIKRAYRKLASAFHPDKYPENTKFAEDMMKSINAAFNVLSDPSKRAQYDLWLDGQQASTEHRKTNHGENTKSKAYSFVRVNFVSLRRYWKPLVVSIFIIFLIYQNNRSNKGQQIESVAPKVVSKITDKKIKMSGISIDDDIIKLNLIGSVPKAQESTGRYVIVKYLLADRNELHATYLRDVEKIVYLETDWGKSQSGSPSDFKNFNYGLTTLHELQQALGNNGFRYKQRPPVYVSDAGDLITMNSFEIKNNKNLVVTFGFKIPRQRAEELRAIKRYEGIGDEFKLDAIILADRKYLDEIWGKEKEYDSSYSPIDLN